MAVPTILAAAEHGITRALVDPHARSVLARLRQARYEAYLVGGSVRDLLLGRVPKDFDIGTSARPGAVKRLFRNCWIVGRRFRLAHVRFGQKTIEVATFRRAVPAEPAPPPVAGRRRPIRTDNTFGTAEQDAFRRDFTINALLYDLHSAAVIDYVGGLADLRAGVVRSIGDPNERFVEDPVRMIRALAFAGRLDFQLDPPVAQAIRRHRQAIRDAAPARLVEELYKILRSGAAESTVRALAETGLLRCLAPGVARAASDGLWRSLAALDRYRRNFDSAPPTLTNPILLGSLVQPVLPIDPNPAGRDEKRPPDVALGNLPLARRDVVRLRQVIQLQPKLHDPARLTPRAQSGILDRSVFAEAVTWLAVHGADRQALDHWRRLEAAGGRTPRRRKRARGRRRRGRGKAAAAGSPQEKSGRRDEGQADPDNRTGD